MNDGGLIHQWWSPLVVVGRSCHALRAVIGFTILTTNNNCTILSALLSTHLHRFQVIEFDVYIPLIVNV